MINIINLRERPLKTKGFQAELKDNQAILDDFEISFNGAIHNMESVGFSLEGDSSRRILYKLYIIKREDQSLSYHLSRIELDPDGFDSFEPPSNALYLFSEIYVEKNGEIVGIVYNSTDEMPFSTNADLMKLPWQFNIRIDESVYDLGESEKERERDV